MPSRELATMASWWRRIWRTNFSDGRKQSRAFHNQNKKPKGPSFPRGLFILAPVFVGRRKIYRTGARVIRVNRLYLTVRLSASAGSRSSRALNPNGRREREYLRMVWRWTQARANFSPRKSPLTGKNTGNSTSWLCPLGDNSTRQSDLAQDNGLSGQIKTGNYQGMNRESKFPVS